MLATIETALLSASLALACGCGEPIKSASRQPRQASAEVSDTELEAACRRGRSDSCVERANRALDSDTPEGHRSARSFFASACNLADAEGCYALGVLVRSGSGGPSVPKRARLLFLRACNLGSAPGCAEHGLMWQRGQGGMRDAQVGRAYLEKSCKLREPRGCHLAAEAWIAARDPSAEAKANELWQRACWYRYRPACERLPADQRAKIESIPDRPSRKDVSETIAKARAALHECGVRNGITGRVTLSFAIGRSGKVRRSSVDRGPEAFRACIIAALDTLRFPESRHGLRVARYPLEY